jgi:hypothetical protein
LSLCFLRKEIEKAVEKELRYHLESSDSSVLLQSAMQGNKGEKMV